MLLHLEKDRNRKYFNYYIAPFFQKHPIIFISISLILGQGLLFTAKIIAVCWIKITSLLKGIWMHYCYASDLLPRTKIHTQRQRRTGCSIKVSFVKFPVCWRLKFVSTIGPCKKFWCADGRHHFNRPVSVEAAATILRMDSWLIRELIGKLCFALFPDLP